MVKMAGRGDCNRPGHTPDLPRNVARIPDSTGADRKPEGPAVQDGDYLMAANRSASMIESCRKAMASTRPLQGA